MTKDVISLSISVLLLFKHYISHKITFGAPSSGGVLCSACGAFIPFVKTSGYHLKVYVFKLNQIHICQTTIVEKDLRRYYVRMNSMSKSKSWQIMVHFARG